MQLQEFSNMAEDEKSITKSQINSPQQTHHYLTFHLYQCLPVPKLCQAHQWEVWNSKAPLRMRRKQYTHNIVTLLGIVVHFVS